MEDNNIIKHMPKRDFHFWVLLSSTLVLAVVSILTPQFLSKYKNRYVSPASPERSSAAATLCTLSYSIPTPTPFICNKNIDIVGMTIDRSSTMNDLETDGRKKLEWAKEAARKFVETVQATGKTNIRISIDSFGSQGNFSQGATGGPALLASPAYDSTLDIALSNNYTNIINTINNIVYKQPGTCIACGLRIANSQVQNVATEKVVILLSDGMANHTWNGGTSGATTAAINEANAGRAMGVSYYAIGYGKAGAINETTLKAIAGDPTHYQYKPNAADWSSAFLNILQNVCSSTTNTPTPTSSVASTVTPTKTATSTPTPTVGVTTNIVASEDAYVYSTNSSTNYGNSTSLQVDGGSSSKITYMKFDLTSLASKTIAKANLRLRITDTSSDTQVIKSVASTTWSESTINYKNRPLLGAAIISFNGGTTGTYKTLDLTSFVDANKGKVVTIAIDETQSDGLDFRSSEYSTVAYRPTLIIQ